MSSQTGAIMDGNREQKDAKDAISSVNSPNPPLVGYLNKTVFVGPMKVNKRRWVVFSDNSCRLYIYNTHEDVTPLEDIDVFSASFVFNGTCLFDVKAEGKLHSFDAQDHPTAVFWLKELQQRRKQFSVRKSKDPFLESRLEPEGRDGSFMSSVKSQAGQRRSLSQFFVDSASVSEKVDSKKPVLLDSFLSKKFDRKSKFSKKRQTSTDEGMSNSSIKTDDGRVACLQEEVAMLEHELTTRKKVIEILHRETEALRQENNLLRSASTDNERTGLLMEKEKRILALSEEKKFLIREIEQLQRELRIKEKAVAALEDETEELRGRVTVKDELIRQLSRSDGRETVNYVELERLRDSCRAYEKQNQFLNQELTEIHQLRDDDRQREKELMSRYTELEATHYQLQSKYLILLHELQRPRNGQLDSQSEEVIRLLLDDATNKSTDKMAYLLPFRENRCDEYGFYQTATGNLAGWSRHAAQQSDQIAGTTIEQRNAWRARWEGLMMQLQQKPPEEWCQSAEFKNLIRTGVPPELRKAIWRQCVHRLVRSARTAFGANCYRDNLTSSNKNPTSPAAKQIELDLMRTLPNNRNFESRDSQYVTMLQRVLLAFSHYNPVIGYCQGLNRIAAVALLVLQEEEEAFWCVVAIVCHLLPQDYYTKTLIGAQVDQRVFRDMLSEKLPRIDAHLNKGGVDPTLVTFNWFLTVFVDSLPTETFLRIWDVFLLEGSKVLFRYALGIFKSREEDILQISDYLPLYRCLRSLGEQAVNADRISQIAFHELNPFPLRAIQVKRRQHEQQVLRELKEQEQIQRQVQFSPEMCRSCDLDDDD